MNRRVRIHRLFALDLREQAAWYDERSRGLGLRLEREADRCLDDVINRPGSFRVVAGGIRRALLPTFPHYVVFTVQAEELHVLGLVHAARDFDRWLEQRRGT